jgi:hypothetical protein
MECGYTIVLVDNALLTQAGLRKLWQREGSAIIDKWKPVTNDCDHILFVRNKLEHPHDSTELKYFEGDYQICLKGVFGKCISRDERLFYVGLDDWINRDGVVGKVGDKNLYIQFLD